jgi:serine phosphatase RsbU (regulator of sigma subunit)
MVSEERPVVLLVEDDDGDAVLVEELLYDADQAFELIRVSSMSAVATQSGRRVDCALIDLGLPDVRGLGALEAFRKALPEVPVVVLTGLSDGALGLEAVAAGAQDYLVKGEVNGPQLGRILRYAMQRKRVDDAARHLYVADRRQAESDRLARGLLPRPVIQDPAVLWATRYEPGGADMIVGGDFFDSIELADGTVRAVVGDVCGHGPDEAAIGVALRIAWRSLVLAGLEGDDVLRSMNELLRLERHNPDLFTTMCDVDIAADRRSMRVRLCGHPPPILLGPGTVRLLEEVTYGVALGVRAEPPSISTKVDLPADWGILLYTDGLFEGRVPDGTRLGLERMVGLIGEVGQGLSAGAGHAIVDGDRLLELLIERVCELNGGPLADDVALSWLARLADGLP